MDLRGITLNEMSDSEKQIPYDFTYMWNLKSKINKYNRNSLIDTENKLMIVSSEGFGAG